MTKTGLGRRYWNLLTTFTAASLGDGFSIVAFPLLAITLTDDARGIALVSVFRFLPFLVVGLPAGVLLDRVDRRLAGIVAQIGRAGIMATLAALVASDRATIGVLVGLAFAIGVGEVVTDAGLPAMVQDVVTPSRLEVANSRLSATGTVTNVFVGPPLGAALFVLDPTGPFVASAVLYVGAAGLLLRLPGRYRPDVEPATGSFGHELTVGLRYVWGHEVLRPLALAVAVFAFVGEANNAIFVVLATERFGLGGVGFGLLVGVDGVASLITSFFVARLVSATSHAFSMKVSVVTFALGSLLFGGTTLVAGAVVAALLGGISDPSWNVVSSTVRQRLVPPRIFGRMMTAYLFVAWSFQPLGALLGGVVAERFGPRWVYLVSGAVVGSLLVLGRPMFRALDAAMADQAGSGRSTDPAAAHDPQPPRRGHGAEDDGPPR